MTDSVSKKLGKVIHKKGDVVDKLYIAWTALDILTGKPLCRVEPDWMRRKCIKREIYIEVLQSGRLVKEVSIRTQKLKSVTGQLLVINW